MLDATTTMKQAGMTAHDWMLEAQNFVEKRFAGYPPEARATLIAAYVNAAAKDEIAMYLRALGTVLNIELAGISQSLATAQRDAV